MKERHGFVSNSSSSSFICCISGEAEAGYDCSNSEMGYCQCENGHEFLASYLDGVKLDDPRDWVKCLDDSMFSDKHSSLGWKERHEIERHAMETLIELKEYYGEDIYNKVLAEFEDDFESFTEVDYNLSAKLCPVCSMKEIVSDDMVNYLLKVSGKSAAEIKQEMKDKFSSLDELNKFVK
jgi:hypothetical protein